MIYEYAIEPAILSAWASEDRDFREFAREYDLGTPRIISSFPKKKISKLRSYLLQHEDRPRHEQSLAGQRYVEMVQDLINCVVSRDIPEEQPLPWRDAVINENHRVPFGVILSSTQISEENNTTPSVMYLNGSIWHHPRQLNIPRTCKDLFSAISNLVRLAEKNIIIIDPYGGNASAIDFIQFMLNSINKNRVSNKLPSIGLFYKKTDRGNSPNAAYVKNQIIERLSDEARSLRIQVFELQETTDSDVFHNRAILTEHGGVTLGHGIGVSNQVNHTDDVTLMSNDVYTKKWNQFVGQNCFEVVSEA